MNALNRMIFVAITIAALGAVGVTTAITNSVAPAYATGGECHQNTGSIGCTGPGFGNLVGPAPDGSGKQFICNKPNGGNQFPSPLPAPPCISTGPK